MHLFDLPPELLLLIVKLLDIGSKHSLRLSCKHGKTIVDEPSVWRNTCLQLKVVETIHKSFWKTLRTRQIRHLSLISARLIPKHFETIFKYLSSSLISLCTPCTIVHMNYRVLVKLQIGKLEHLTLYCGLMLVPCEGCETSNLTKFSSLRSLTFHNVTNTYLQHLSKDLSKLIIPKLEILKIVGTSVLSVLHFKGHLAAAVIQQPSLKEVYIPEYSLMEDSFFTIFKDHNPEQKRPPIETLQILSPCHRTHLQNLCEVLKNSLTTLYVCINAEEASSVMTVLTGLTFLRDLGIKFESLPREPSYYCLEQLPKNLSHLSLAFEISHTPIVPPFGLKLLHSGSRWFSAGVLASIPRKLRQRLQVLWLATVMLKAPDIDILQEDFHQLTTLTCRFMEDVPKDHLLKLCGLPKLRTVYLHGVKNEEDMAGIQNKISEFSRNRLHLYMTMYHLLELPGFTMCEKKTVARFKHLPRSLISGHAQILLNGIL